MILKSSPVRETGSVSATAGTVKVEAKTISLKATSDMKVKAGGTLVLKGATVNINERRIGWASQQPSKGTGSATDNRLIQSPGTDVAGDRPSRLQRNLNSGLSQNVRGIGRLARGRRRQPGLQYTAAHPERRRSFVNPPQNQGEILNGSATVRIELENPPPDPAIWPRPATTRSRCRSAQCKQRVPC